MPIDCVTLLPVTAANYNAVIQLGVRPQQLHLVASNSVTLAQAAYEPGSWLRAVYHGPTLVRAYTATRVWLLAQSR
eukprot:SAG31_NODE_2737_length_5157_cov_7.756869_6_plen_76_part_00